MNKTVISLAAATLISTGYAAAANASELHTVQQGDTLFSVANQYKLSVAQLKELNKLESNNLAINDRLVVSTKQASPVTTAAAVYTVQSGDSLSKIAARHKTSVAAIKQANSLTSDFIYVGQTLKVNGNAVKAAPAKTTAAPTAAGTYTVQSGDSLSKIAGKYKISVAALKQANGLTSDVIYAGQKLKVSGSASSAEPKPALSSTVTVSKTAVYKVQSGDSLSKIASKYGITVAAIKQANGLTSDVIFVGQNLKVSGSVPASSTKTVAKPPAVKSSTGVYTVQSGDSLSKIAAKHSTTVAAIKQLNGLKTDTIFVGQKLTVSGSASQPKTTSTPSPVSSIETAVKPSTSVYIVQKGDSLSKIASKHSTTVAAIKQANGLKTDSIFVGQKLTVSGSKSTSKPATSTTAPDSADDYSFSKLMSAAKSVMGTPYVWGGSDPSGFDCSGFIYYVYNQAGQKMPRTNTDGFFNRSYQVSNPQPGDFVFFSNTYKKGISHMGIYIGDNQFVHASSSLGVAITSLDNPYFKSKFTSFNRPYWSY